MMVGQIVKYEKTKRNLNLTNQQYKYIMIIDLLPT